MPFVPGSYAPGSYDTQRSVGVERNQKRVNFNSVEEQNKREGVESQAQALSDDNTHEELMEKAQEQDVEGRSEMNKEELATAVAQVEAQSTAQARTAEQSEQSDEDESDEDESDEGSESDEDKKDEKKDDKPAKATAKAAKKATKKTD